MEPLHQRIAGGLVKVDHYIPTEDYMERTLERESGIHKIKAPERNLGANFVVNLHLPGREPRKVLAL